MDLLSLPMQLPGVTTDEAVALSEVEQKVFESNESAREVLQSMGLEKHQRERRPALAREEGRLGKLDCYVKPAAQDEASGLYMDDKTANRHCRPRETRATCTIITLQVILWLE